MFIPKVIIKHVYDLLTFRQKVIKLYLDRRVKLDSHGMSVRHSSGTYMVTFRFEHNVQSFLS